MKRISALILGLLLSAVFIWPAGAGTLTTNKFFYKPSLGARGDTEKQTFDAGLDRIDTRLGKEIWVGDPNYGATLKDAITAIGGSQAILRIPVGAYAVPPSLVIPANITLRFENGGVLDLSGLMDAHIAAMTAATACQVTVTGHGLQTGDKVKFYGIQQCYVSGSSHALDWMFLNDQIYTVTRVDADNFTIPVNTSAYHAYVPASDPGRVCAPLQILGKIEANRQKIFNITSRGQVSFSNNFSSNVRPTNPRAQVDAYPEWFGAVGDGGVTDDLLALDACFHALKYYDKAYGTIHLSKFYGVSNTWSLNEIGIADFGQFNVVGVGRNTSGIVGMVPAANAGCDNKPVVEAIGAACLRFKGWGIYGTTALTSDAQPAGAPSVGLMLGASQTTINTAGSDFNDMYFYGWFKYGTVINRGHAQSQWTNHETSIHTWYDGVTPTYAFDYFFGAGDRPLIWPALVPTNSTWNTWAGNRDCGGNVLDIIKTSTYGTMATGSTCVYQDKANVRLSAVLCGNTRDYNVYACNSFVDMQYCGSDGSGTVAGVYVTSDSARAGYPNSTSVVRIENSGNASAGGVFLMTDAYTTLINSKVSYIYGNNGYKIQLGAGASYSRFDNLYSNLTSFTIAGNVVGSYIEVPSTCNNFSMMSGVDAGSIIVRQGPYYNGGQKTIIDGSLQLGMPYVTTVPTLTLTPYKMAWSAAAPTTDSWAKGSVIWKIGAAAGTSPGWNCRLDNTPGTLNSGATTGSITAGTKTLTVSSVTGLHIGDFIDVVADAGGNAVSIGRIVNIDATNKIVTLYANASATATAKAVSYHNEATAAAFEAMPATLARTSGVTAAATSPITVTHGLGVAPTKVLLTSVDGVPTGIFPNTFGATTFVINFAGGGSHAFYWEAIQ